MIGVTPVVPFSAWTYVCPIGITAGSAQIFRGRSSQFAGTFPQFLHQYRSWLAPVHLQYEVSGGNRLQAGLLDEIIRQITELRDRIRFDPIHVVDVLLVAFLIYRVLVLVRGTRAWRIVGGIVTFVVLLLLSSWLRFETTYWILDKATLLAPVALVILLLPELRSALEGVGKLGFWPKRFQAPEVQVEAQTVEEIVAAVSELSTARIGALIVVERGPPLNDIVANGVMLDSKLTAATLVSIFYPGNPLHDGAVVLRDNRILAAACRLPLSESSRLDSQMHMRHRAAVGVTEAHDCIVVVVSEERGLVSLSADGEIERLESAAAVRERLNHFLRGSEPAPKIRRLPKVRIGGGK